MENIGGLTALIYAGQWGNYLLWVAIYGAMIAACWLGWKRKGNPGFLYLLSAFGINLLCHLPSIILTMRLHYSGFSGSLEAGYTRYISVYYAIRGALSLLSAVLLIIGLFRLAGHGGPATNTQRVQSDSI